MSAIAIVVEPQIGAELYCVAGEMVALATKLGIDVRAEFNDVPMRARPGGDAVKLANEARAVMMGERQFAYS